MDNNTNSFLSLAITLLFIIALGWAIIWGYVQVKQIHLQKCEAMVSAYSNAIMANDSTLEQAPLGSSIIMNEC